MAFACALLVDLESSGTGPVSIVHPPPKWFASAHQPSAILRLRTPFAAAFIPLVPLASFGRNGLLSHTSTPSTR